MPKAQSPKPQGSPRWRGAKRLRLSRHLRRHGPLRVRQLARRSAGRRRSPAAAGHRRKARAGAGGANPRPRSADSSAPARGSTTTMPPDNATAIASTSVLLADLDAGLVFINLVETDTVFGHRKDADGFVAALERIDAAVADWLEGLRAGDLLVLTADHGCDITHASSDHTREHAPLLATFGFRRPPSRRTARRRGRLRAAPAGGRRRSRFARVVVRVSTPTLNHPQGGQTPA